MDAERGAAARIDHRVHFLGFVAGKDKSAAYHMARLLVVPSRQEAMSIVALEAGICGIPVMLTDQCGFGEIKVVDPRFEVAATVEALAEGVLNLLGQPDSLDAAAFKLKQFVSQKYLWASLVERYLDLYRSLIKGVEANN